MQILQQFLTWWWSGLLARFSALQKYSKLPTMLLIFGLTGNHRRFFLLQQPVEHNNTWCTGNYPLAALLLNHN